MTLIKENLLRWVEDLESGQHTQVKHHMVLKGEGYCCLGRLCEVAIEHDVPLQRVAERDLIPDTSPNVFGYADPDGPMEFGSYVPTGVSEWVGLDPHTLARYAARNDAGESFEQIATAIRRAYHL